MMFPEILTIVFDPKMCQTTFLGEFVNFSSTQVDQLYQIINKNEQND